MPPFTTEFVLAKEAAMVLGYRSMDTFYDHCGKGLIAGAEKRGSEEGKPGGRWFFRGAELAYVGPTFRPTDKVAQRRAAALEATRPAGGYRRAFLKSARAAA
jgi:hypothetical protein